MPLAPPPPRAIRRYYHRAVLTVTSAQAHHVSPLESTGGNLESTGGNYRRRRRHRARGAAQFSEPARSKPQTRGTSQRAEAAARKFVPDVAVRRKPRLFLPVGRALRLRGDLARPLPLRQAAVTGLSGGRRAKVSNSQGSRTARAVPAAQEQARTTAAEHCAESLAAAGRAWRKATEIFGREWRQH